jgi:uncharacterized damage-inducible protein DinB
MKSRNCILAALFFLAYAADTLAQSDKPLQQRTVAETLESWITHTETLVVPVAEAMPEDKYSFAPPSTSGDFTGVRTFAQQLKHLAANNYRMATLILGGKPSAEMGNENGTDSARTKAEIMEYLKGSFEVLHKSVTTIDERNVVDPITSPSLWQKTRLSFAVDSVAHSMDHFGQLVEYLRMNGIVPPESRLKTHQAMNADKSGGFDPVSQTSTAALEERADPGAAFLDAHREKRAMQIFLKLVENRVVTAAEVMPANKYAFVPTEGEFKGVRSFGQQVKHLAATNHILAAAALEEEVPSGAGDEAGPETVRSKTDILQYLKESFAHLGEAIAAIDSKNSAVKTSPISPLQGTAPTRLSLAVEALIHAFDHYGQMVEYLRMNGIVPPASRS